MDGRQPTQPAFLELPEMVILWHTFYIFSLALLLDLYIFRKPAGLLQTGDIATGVRK